MATLAAMTASVAVILDVSVAWTDTSPPMADEDVPMLVLAMKAAVFAPISFSALEPPPATETPGPPPPAIDSAAATDTEVMVALSFAETWTAPAGVENT